VGGWRPRDCPETEQKAGQETCGGARGSARWPREEPGSATPTSTNLSCPPSAVRRPPSAVRRPPSAAALSSPLLPSVALSCRRSSTPPSAYSAVHPSHPSRSLIPPHSHTHFV